MASFMVYEKITKKQLTQTTKDTINGIKKWFADNPKRKICNAQWVYGEMFKVRRNHVEEDVKEMSAKTDTK